MIRFRALAAVVAGTLVGAALVVLPASSASAQQSSVSGTVAPSWQTNGTVWSLAAANGAVYVGGEFTSVRPPGVAAGTSETARTRLAAFSASTGALVTSFNHSFNGTVRALTT